MNAVNDECRTTLRSKKSMEKSVFPGHIGAQENLHSALIIVDTPFGVAAIAGEQLAAALELASQLTGANGKNPCQVSNEGVRLMTADAASAVLGVPATWLLQRARERRIPFIQLGKYVRFDVGQIRAEMTKEPK